MKGVFLFAALFLFMSIISDPSSAEPPACTELGNMLRAEVRDPSALLSIFDLRGVEKCDLSEEETMCFQCAGGILYTQRNPKTGAARVGRGCPCKSK